MSRKAPEKRATAAQIKSVTRFVDRACREKVVDKEARPFLKNLLARNKKPFSSSAACRCVADIALAAHPGSSLRQDALQCLVTCPPTSSELLDVLCDEDERQASWNK